MSSNTNLNADGTVAWYDDPKIRTALIGLIPFLAIKVFKIELTSEKAADLIVIYGPLVGTAIAALTRWLAGKSWKNPAKRLTLTRHVPKP